MQYVKDAEWYKVVRVTGPTHNMLGLSISGRDSQEPISADALPGEPGAPILLSAQDVRQEVLTGVFDANKEFGRSISISGFQYIETDSPPATTYRLLARKIVERIIQTEGRY